MRFASTPSGGRTNDASLRGGREQDASPGAHGIQAGAMASPQNSWLLRRLAPFRADLAGCRP